MIKRILGIGISSVAAICATLVAGTWLTASQVVTNADRLAANAPYCIQVADGIDYRQANSWLDFSPFAMRGQVENGSAMQFHAILAVNEGKSPRLYNWSYRRMSWEANTVRVEPAVSCSPARAFAVGLPYFIPQINDAGTVKRLRLSGS